MLYRYYLHIILLMSIKPVPRRSEDVPLVTDCNWLHFFSLERTLDKSTRFNNEKRIQFLHFIHRFMMFVYMIVNNVNINQRFIELTTQA